MSALILGVGNVLIGDEGIGIRIIEELDNRYIFPDDVSLLDGGTAGVELLRYIEGKKLLILIDAMAADHPPGTVYQVEGEDVPKQFLERISPHQIGLSDLLATGMLSDNIPENIILFCVEPERLETGMYISDSVAKSIDKIINPILDHLEKSGYEKPQPNPHPKKSLFWS